MKKWFCLPFPTVFLALIFASVHLPCAAQNGEKTDNPILDFCEKEPKFRGGEKAMAKFIQAEVVYPIESRKNGEQGVVYVQFVVAIDGSITEVKVVKGVSPLLDAEAMRVVKAMPKWKPGKQNGKIVRVRYTLPINFRISS